MQENQQQSTSLFFRELSLRLKQAGIESEMRGEQFLRITSGGQPVCDVALSGETYGNTQYPKLPESDNLYFQTAGIAGMVKEYTTALETAPALCAESLDAKDGYRLLTEYNGTVLAGKESEYGCMFATWERGCGGKTLENGHYTYGDYVWSKEDFARRSGMVEGYLLFNNEQLTLIREALVELQENTLLSDQQNEQCSELIRKIGYKVPELEQPVSYLEQSMGQ